MLRRPWEQLAWLQVRPKQPRAEPELPRLLGRVAGQLDKLVGVGRQRVRQLLLKRLGPAWAEGLDPWRDLRRPWLIEAGAALLAPWEQQARDWIAFAEAQRRELEADDGAPEPDVPRLFRMFEWLRELLAHVGAFADTVNGQQDGVLWDLQLWRSNRRLDAAQDGPDPLARLRVLAVQATHQLDVAVVRIFGPDEEPAAPPPAPLLFDPALHFDGDPLSQLVSSGPFEELGDGADADAGCVWRPGDPAATLDVLAQHVLPCVGRDLDAQHAVALLKAQKEQRKRADEAARAVQGAVCLWAEEGMGKSALAVEVARRAHAAGLCPAGIAVVDLTGVSSMHDIMWRVCAALGLRADRISLEAMSKDVVARLERACLEHGGPALLVLDNVDDALDCEDAETFGGFAAKLAREAMVVMTARSKAVASEEEFRPKPLRALADEHCVALMRLHDAEEQLLRLCAGSPLLAKLVARCDIAALRAAADANDTHRLSRLLMLALRALPPRLRHACSQLAILPDAASAELAAAVLGCDVARARALLRELVEAGLATYDACRRTYALRARLRAQLRDAPLPETRLAFARHAWDRMARLQRGYFSSDWMPALVEGWQRADALVAAFACVARAPVGSACMVRELLDHAAVHGVPCKLLGALGLLSAPEVDAAALRMCKDASSDQEQLRLAYALQWRSATGLGLGRFAEAAADAVRAWELLERRRGGAHPHSVAALAHAAACRVAMGRPEEALCREALRRTRGAFGPESPEACAAACTLAACLQLSSASASDEAEALWREALDARDRRLGPEHPETIVCMTSLAACRESRGAPTALREAERLYVQVLERRKASLGPEHPSTITALHNVAHCLEAEGFPSEAAELQKEVWELRSKTLGKDHVDTVAARGVLAACLQKKAQKATAGRAKIRREAAAMLLADGVAPTLETLATAIEVPGCHNPRCLGGGRCEKPPMLCRGCMRVRYCSEACARQAWAAGHVLQCKR